MRFVCWICFVAACAISTTASAAASDHYVGISLGTDYPTQTLQLKDQESIELTVHNYGLDPQVIAVAIKNLPQGWKAHLEGDGHTVGSAFVGTDDTQSLQLKIKPGPDVTTGKVYQFQLQATGNDSSATLPLALTFTHAPPAAMKLKVELPTLKGSSSATFTYHLTLDNESDRAVNANLTADTPDGFEADFSPQFGSNNITSLPIKAGDSKKVDVKVTAPHNAKAAAYPIKVGVKAGQLTAETTLTAVITGKPKLNLTTPSGQLSGSAYAGQTTAVNLVVHNTGSAPARAVRMTADTPAQWKVTFHPSRVDAIPPDGKAKIVADVDPSGRSLAGDYMVTFEANSNLGAANASADYRVTVSTSTYWGIIGIAIVAIALIVVGFAVARYGRR